MNGAQKTTSSPGTRELLGLAQAFGLFAWGLLLWIAMHSGVIDIPLLRRWVPPSSAIPGLLWAAAAYRFWTVRDLTPGWNAVTRRLAIAAALHLYLLPYLGWWHASAPEWYQRLNTMLLAVAVALGATGAFRLAYEVAVMMRDRLLRAEIWICIIAMPALAGAFALLLRWSALRAGAGEASIIEWFALLRELPGGPRVALMMIPLIPMMPFAILMFEVRARVLEWLVRRSGGQDEVLHNAAPAPDFRA